LSNEHQLIKSLEELKTLCSKDENWPDFGRAECFILLNGGMRSSKDITYYPKAGAAELGEEDEDINATDVFTEHGYIDEGNARKGLKVHWEVFHGIDDTYAEYTTDQALLDQTHIGEALEKNALFIYG